MNKDIISFKETEYIGRAGVAYHRGDLERAKKDTRTMLVLYRLRAREAVTDLVLDTDALRSLKRALKKAEQAGIMFPMGEKRVKTLEEKVKLQRQRLVGYGESIVVTLDYWQSIGATLADLCNLCNRDYAQVLEQIKPERADREFSSLIFVYNLDYKDPRNRGWIDFDVDAPFTHAVKEFFLDRMINTPEGREASHRAMEECFPGIMEGALMEVTDADGVRRLIDKDGVEVATLDGEE